MKGVIQELRGVLIRFRWGGISGAIVVRRRNVVFPSVQITELYIPYTWRLHQTSQREILEGRFCYFTLMTHYIVLYPLRPLRGSCISLHPAQPTESPSLTFPDRLILAAGALVIV
jgi:hypothetical protein